MWKWFEAHAAAGAVQGEPKQVSLARLSMALLLVVGVVLFAAAFSTQQLFSSMAERYYQQRVTLLASSVTRQLATVLTAQITAVETAAQAPELAMALIARDGGIIAAQEEALRARLTGAMRVRLVQPGAPGEQGGEFPALTFADLELVRDKVGGASGAPVEAHLPGSPAAHIDIVKTVPGPNGAAGYLLVSYPLASLQKTLTHLSLPVGYMEIRQGEGVVLASYGDAALAKSERAGRTALTGTRWEVYYWPPAAEVAVLRQQLWYWGIFGIAFVILAGIILGFSRWATRAVRADLDTLMDLMRNQHDGIGQQIENTMRLAEFQGTADLINSFRHMPASAAPVAEVTTPSPQSGLDVTMPVTTPYFPEELTEMHEQPHAARARSGTVPGSIFRAYDIRGIVGDTLTEDIVFEIGRAIGSEAYARGQQSVIVARDGRLSGPALLASLSDGLRASGRDVIDIGQVPTPVLYFAAHYLNAESGVMLTGSHNPPGYNGLKIVLRGDTLAEEDIQALRRRIETGELTSGSGSLRHVDVAADYIHRITSDVRLARPLKVVVDCGNGVAGELAPRLLRELGCEVYELYCEVDGHFPNHHPDPSQPENLSDLIETVQSRAFDLGLAFDGDGDRLGVVDGKGTIIWPDRQMMLYAKDILGRHPGAQIMFDVKCSRHLARVVSKEGGQPLMWKTGHSLIKRKMKETGALLAGEMSGHIFFKERWFGFDDALYTAARLLEILAADKRSPHAVFVELPNAVNTPELRVDLKEGEQLRIMQRIVEMAQFKGAVLTTIDGLRVDFEDGWGLVRASNTTPSLILRFEATTPAVLKRIQQDFRLLMLKAEPQLVVPF